MKKEKMNDWKENPRDSFFWENNKTNKTLFVYWFAVSPDFVVRLIDHDKKLGLENPKELGSFKTKQKAVDFATEYMEVQ